MNDEIKLMEIAKDLTIAIAAQKDFLTERQRNEKKSHEQILGVFKTCLNAVREEATSKESPGSR